MPPLTLDSWRNACLVEINPDRLAAYFQPLMMPFDRFFYNETRGVYTVDRWLDFLEEEHGGIDSVLLWPTYTNIGADDRNQFELVESLPVEYW
jgi:iron(II)-dependent oxidoreductase